MSSSLLLDGLLLLVVLLFIPIGLWRGGVREAIVAGGIVLGGALAGSWARPWGDDLASQLDLRPQTARFLVALAALLGATLCVGYAGGAALRPGAPGLLGRVAGGLLAGLNGLLLLGYGLGFLDQYVLE
ncbi:MAG: CvpA family protein, partial [Chloroflexota bacterium]|nr:CvpA family protein [Chloroflexota bacterium]